MPTGAQGWGWGVGGGWVNPGRILPVLPLLVPLMAALPCALGSQTPALGPCSSIPVPALPQPQPVPAARSLCQGDMSPEPGPSLSSPSSGLVPCLNSTESALAFPSMLSVCLPLMEARGGGQS